MHFASNPTEHLFNFDGTLALGGSIATGLLGEYSMRWAWLNSSLVKVDRVRFIWSVAASAGASYLNASSFKSHTMDKFSASYLLGAPIIFKLTQEEAVTVIPLVKKRPLTTVTSIEIHYLTEGAFW